MCYDMEEPWKHDVKWKKPDIKAYVWDESIYIKHPEQATLQRQQVE